MNVSSLKETVLKDLQWNERMKILRCINGMSQAEVAKLCNSSQKNYYLWEVGRSFPRKNSRIAICKALGVSNEIIFDEE